MGLILDPQMWKSLLDRYGRLYGSCTSTGKIIEDHVTDLQSHIENVFDIVHLEYVQVILLYY